MRAIAIAAGEVMAAGGSVKPGDHVDILATYHDPITNTDTTKMMLQNVLVLAVNGGETDASRSKGASSSMTLAVDPKDAELLTAADRSGVLRVALRPVGERDVIPSAGVTSRDFAGSKVFDIPTQAQTQQVTRVTPIILRDVKRSEITVIRGTAEQIITP
jgi:pilus assembly protein CpaB